MPSRLATFSGIRGDESTSRYTYTRTYTCTYIRDKSPCLGKRRGCPRPKCTLHTQSNKRRRWDVGAAYVWSLRIPFPPPPFFSLILLQFPRSSRSPFAETPLLAFSLCLSFFLFSCLYFSVPSVRTGTLSSCPALANIWWPLTSSGLIRRQPNNQLFLFNGTLRHGRRRPKRGNARGTDESGEKLTLTEDSASPTLAKSSSLYRLSLEQECN